MKALTTLVLALVAGMTLAACAENQRVEERSSYSDESQYQTRSAEPMVRDSQSK